VVGAMVPSVAGEAVQEVALAVLIGTVVGEAPAALCRLYAAGPRLLCAGIADGPGSRWEQHAQRSPWSGGARCLRPSARQWADESKGMGRACGNLPVSCLNEGLSPASAEHMAGRTHPAGEVVHIYMRPDG